MAERGRPLTELEHVQHASEFARELAGARFEMDGAPFHTHLIGTASAMVQLDAPVGAIAAALCHSVFYQGDWCDDARHGVTPGRVARLRDRLGDTTTEYVLSFGEVLREPATELVAKADDLDDAERWRILARLCDLLEKWDDGGVMFSTGRRQDVEYMAAHGDTLIELARRLGTEEFAASLDGARSPAWSVPASLQLGRETSVVLLPPSAMLRPSVHIRELRWRVRRAARHAVRLVRRRLRTRTSASS